jgi:hypothetical protein
MDRDQRKHLRSDLILAAWLLTLFAAALASLLLLARRMCVSFVLLKLLRTVERFVANLASILVHCEFSYGGLIFECARLHQATGLP